MAQHRGSNLPDPSDIFAHVSTPLGISDFGVPRYPGERHAAELPIAYLKAFWPAIASHRSVNGPSSSGSTSLHPA